MISETTFQSQRMYDVIASSFFQKKYCRLPGIGTLELITMPAEYDFPNKQIIAPQQKIIFISASSADKVFNEFSAISQLLKEKLEHEGSVFLSGLGTFLKDSNGVTIFLPAEISADFFQPVTAERVIHKDAEHAILVGDKETTNTVMTEYYTEETAGAKDRWWLWAIVLGVVGLAVIGYYLYQYHFNDLSSRNIF